MTRTSTRAGSWREWTTQGVAEYHLADALGSVRGVTDGAGLLAGTTHYDVFGEVRAASGVSTLFRFTGEQYDAETGFTFLRARYHNPTIARFISADTVQPNAPGTQGYNLYAYVANNPTTWAGPEFRVASFEFRRGSPEKEASPQLKGRISIARPYPHLHRVPPA